MASYSGKFISNLEKTHYVGSGSNKCKLRDDSSLHIILLNLKIKQIIV